MKLLRRIGWLNAVMWVAGVLIFRFAVHLNWFEALFSATFVIALNELRMWLFFRELRD